MRKNCAAAVLVIIASCAQGVTKEPSRSDNCPPKYPFEYFDQAHGFRICLPRAVTKDVATDYPAGSIRFRGFAVPGKANLESKQLIIVPGEYDLLTNATPSGKFNANGVMFTRSKFTEGSAGHLDRHIVYTWKQGKNAVHFDFVYHSVNVANIDPASRPVEYSLAAQIKLTDQMMRTFKRL
jgi:hypothetical protein